MTCFRKITVEAVIWKGEGLWVQLIVAPGEGTRPLIKALPAKTEQSRFLQNDNIDHQEFLTEVILNNNAQ